MNNLPELRDIHLPSEITSFPLGWGWFVLLMIPFILYIISYIYRKGRKYYALKLLSQINGDNVFNATKISELLRRVCRYKYPDAVALFGKDWLNFLNQHSKKTLSGQAAELLIYAPYLPQNKSFSDEDYQALRYFTKQWIGENL